MRKKITVLYKVTAIILFCLFPIALNKVQAAVTIEPIQEFRVNRGDSLTGYINIAFTPSDPNVLYLSLEKLTVDEKTNLPESDPVSPSENTLANWITLESNVAYKPANLQYQNNDNVVRVKYTIKVPQDAEPGSDYAAVIISENKTNTESNAVGVSKDNTTSILITVNGDIKEEGDLVSFNTINNQFLFTHLPAEFEAKFTNKGNVHVIPRGNIEIFNFGEKIDNISLNPNQSRVLPDRTLSYFRKWSNENIEEMKDDAAINTAIDSLPKNFFEEVIYQIRNFRVGIYSAELQGFAGKKQIKSSVTFLVFPVQLTLTVIALLSITYAYVKTNNKRNKTKSKKR